MANPRTLKDETRVLREAITQVLMRATRPMTSSELASAAEVAATGIPKHKAALCVAHMYRLKSGLVLHRIDNDVPGKYYVPSILPDKLLKGVPFSEEGTKRVAAPVNPVKSGPAAKVFEFDADKFELQAVPAANVDVPVQVPAGVKCITLSVGGVSIKIELQ